MKLALAQPIVVFVFAKNTGEKSTRFGGFVTRLKKAGHLENYQTRVIALEDLIFAIDDEGIATVTDINSNPVVDDASLIYFKSWSSELEPAVALAQYASAKGIPVMDEAVLNVGTHKLSQLFTLWAAGVTVTPTIFSRRSDFSLPKGKDKLFIVKPVHGEKGRKNSLVDRSAVAKTLHDSSSPMLVQPFIPNEGDYRVLVYGYKVRGALYRQAAEGSHLNNTSAGASSTFIAADQLPPELVAMAIKAAKTMRLSVAGVDIIVSSQTGRMYVLEVNQGSQVVTGHFVTEKMAAFDAFMHETIQSRYPRKQSRLEMIGRHVRVNIPNFGLDSILAKVDTGAYQSALNASDISIEKVDGSQILHFTVAHQLADGKNVAKKQSVNEFDIVQVTNTSGIPQQRYRIRVPIEIHGKTFKTPVTLVDRSEMKSPLLLGRRLLRGRFLINPELSRKAYEAQL